METSLRSENIYSLPVLYVIFFVSGLAALLYQLLWQRALFGIYGTNTESVTIVVAAFMLGLGLGSVAGGKLSKILKYPLPVVFGLLELVTGVYGFVSLELCYWVGSYTAVVSVLMAGILAFLLVVFPTSLMGATFPILVAYVVKQTNDVGRSVGTLYFVNTLGSAAACFIASVYLFNALGMRGSVFFAAILDVLIGVLILGLWMIRRQK